MIQAGVIHHLQNRMDSACLRIVGPVHQTPDAGMNRRSRAHGARLNCSKQLAVAKPVITKGSSRFAERHDFRVRAGIEVGQVAIPTSSHHAPAAHDHCSHRHFARLERALGAAQGFFHPKFVGGRLVSGKFVSREQLSVTKRRVAGKQFSVLGSQFPEERTGPWTDPFILAGESLRLGWEVPFLADVRVSARRAAADGPAHASSDISNCCAYS